MLNVIIIYGLIFIATHFVWIHYLSDHIDYDNDMHDYLTRNWNNIYLLKTNKTIFMNLLFFKRFKDSNSLPCDVKRNSSLIILKSELITLDYNFFCLTKIWFGRMNLNTKITKKSYDNENGECEFLMTFLNHNRSLHSHCCLKISSVHLRMSSKLWVIARWVFL